MTTNGFARLLQVTAGAGLALGLAACDALPPKANWVAIRPVAPDVGAPTLPDEADYQSAVVAINGRDYAHALDLLQAARARKPDDARVLNAFGVVYDKLDRFDLSARYYAQAKALDPTSQIVANNLAYSSFLRAKVGDAAERPTHLASTPVSSAPVALASLIRPSAVQLESPQALSLDIRPARVRSRPLVLINASGRLNGAQAVRLTLARLGWAEAPKVGEAPPRIWTTISYPSGGHARAQALAATLPTGAKLVPCAACVRLHLVVGSQLAAQTPRTEFRSSQRSRVG